MLIVGLLVGSATAVLFAIVYAVTDIYLSGHSIKVENHSIEVGFMQITGILEGLAGEVSFVASARDSRGKSLIGGLEEDCCL